MNLEINDTWLENRIATDENADCTVSNPHTPTVPDRTDGGGEVNNHETIELLRRESGGKRTVWTLTMPKRMMDQVGATVLQDLFRSAVEKSDAEDIGGAAAMVSHPDNCKPTVPGWYWCTRRFKEPRWAIVFVMETDIHNGSYADCEFRGPLQEPEATK